MNLSGIASGVVGAVTPLQVLKASASIGYTIGPDGSQAPAYAAETDIIGQVQALSSEDLRHLDSLNIQGERRCLYLPGSWSAVARVDGKGGDLFRFAEATGGPLRTWLVVVVLETWPDWTRVAVTLQVD